MLHYENDKIKSLLLKGKIGLEKESLRITADGHMAHSVHPFKGDKYIVRDFCENQTEINTPPLNDAHEATEFLAECSERIEKVIAQNNEYLWPFSNPPYIINEKDIPIAKYDDDEKEKENYRYYLADRYGRYKMTFSGIHFNYSFSEDLLKAEFELLDTNISFEEYKSRFYLELAGKMQMYNWLVVAITAASPLLDSSYFEKKVYDRDVFNGMSSTRCSECGYWNYFTPVLKFESIDEYANAIEKYIDAGLIRSSSELYFPVRLKPPGVNSLKNLRKKGVSHIELRMIDLNPLVKSGIEEKDVLFIQLLLVYLACMDAPHPSVCEQIMSIQNTKNAARYDLKTVKILLSEGKSLSVINAAKQVIEKMYEFYKDYPDYIKKAVEFQYEKFTENPKNRYSWQIRERFGGGFVKKGLKYIKERQ